MSGINEELGNEVLNSAKSGKGIVDFLSKLLLQSMKQNTFLDQTQKSMKAMMEYIKKGGEIKTSLVGMEDSQIFENYMKAFNVPYVKCHCVDPQTKEEKISYIYRAVDEGLVRKVKEKYLNELGFGLSELDPREIITLNKNEDIMVVSGLDRVEIEAFRQNVPANSVQFAVKESDEYPGKYDIMFKKTDEKTIKDLIKDMNYDLAGKEGREYREKITKVLEEKEAFDKSLLPADGETVYVVDRDCPNNFIALTNHGFTLHTLNREEQRGFDNSITEIIKDKVILSEAGYNREKLMKYVGGMTQAVVLKENEFGIIKGIGPSGNAIPLQGREFRDAFNNVAVKVKSSNKYYKPEKLIPTPDKLEKVYTYENLPVNLLDDIRYEIENRGLKNTVLIGDQLAFSEKDRAVVEANITPILYKDLPVLSKIEAEMFYEGKGNIQLTETMDQPQYLVSEQHPEIVVEIKKDVVNVLRDGKPEESLDRNSVDFAEQLRVITQQMENPVALSLEEMRREERRKLALIRQRSFAMELRENEATEYLKSQEQTAKDILHKASSSTDTRYDLSERQVEALEKTNGYEIKEVFVDRDFYNKTIESTIKEKLHHEMEYEEKHTPKGR